MYFTKVRPTVHFEIVHSYIFLVGLCGARGKRVLCQGSYVNAMENCRDRRHWDTLRMGWIIRSLHNFGCRQEGELFESEGGSAYQLQ